MRELFETPAKAWTAVLVGCLLSIHLYEFTKPTEVDIVNYSMRSVVAIECRKNPTALELLENPEAVSTSILTAGFVATDYGHILTVAHGLTECRGKYEKNLRVRFWSNPSVAHRVKILRYNGYHDAALLQVPTAPDDTRPLNVSHRSYRPGTTAIALGHPEFLYWSASKGIISAERYWGDSNKQVVQVSSLINQGNSGGPTIDENGEVIGIASFNINGNATLGFLVPGTILEQFLNGIYK